MRGDSNYKKVENFTASDKNVAFNLRIRRLLNEFNYFSFVELNIIVIYLSIVTLYILQMYKSSTFGIFYLFIPNLLPSSPNLPFFYLPFFYLLFFSLK